MGERNVTIVRVPKAPVARVFGPLSRILNPVVLRLSGTRHVTLWGVVRHRGRRSGRAYATPVAIAHAADRFFIPLPFGSEADWPRNVLSAGGCVIRWKGADHEVIDPEVIDLAAGRHAFNPIEGIFLRWLGIRSILRLREAPQAVLSSSRQSVA